MFLTDSRLLQAGTTKVAHTDYVNIAEHLSYLPETFLTDSGLFREQIFLSFPIFLA